MNIYVDFFYILVFHFSGYTEQIKEPHDFFSGRYGTIIMYVGVFFFFKNKWRFCCGRHWCRLGNVEFVVCRDDDGKIAAFHNVCRHHASLLVSGSGKSSCFTCPYHVCMLMFVCIPFDWLQKLLSRVFC